MARQKQDILDRLFSNLSLRGILIHPATLFVIATVTMIGSAIFLWERHQDKIVNLDEFQLTEEKIRLTAPPAWAKTDLKQLVLKESPDSKPSILDTRLVSRTANVMRKVGFVERVRSIQKSKSGLDIDVVYRHPVALVELSKVTIPEWPDSNRDKHVVLPVDRYGIVMPESLGEGQNLLLINVLYPAQFSNLTTWADWPDVRIKDAASIAGLFVDSADQLGIKWIADFRKPNETENSQIPLQLGSGTGTRIIWGNAPGKELEAESNAKLKILAIEAVVAEYGRLDRVNLGNLDVRSGRIVAAGDTKTAANPEAIFADLK